MATSPRQRTAGGVPAADGAAAFDEVRAAGYEGGYSRVRDYVHEVRPREPAKPAVRFETPPGRQGQCSATRGCCGCGSIRGRPWRR